MKKKVGPLENGEGKTWAGLVLWKISHRQNLKVGYVLVNLLVKFYPRTDKICSAKRSLCISDVTRFLLLMTDRAMGRCYHLVPCLSDPARRSSLGLKLALVSLHLVYAGILFLFDEDLIEKTKGEPWYTALYLLLFFATLVQYFIASSSSPGYVIDVMRSVNENNVIFPKTSVASKQPASSKNGSLVITVDGSHLGRNLLGSNTASWSKLVMDMYPPGTSARNWTCSYCNVEQPPRAKHCHDCDKCVLQFDHHCVWLGTCIGQGNHCRFWWYICEETALCLWTGILYIAYLKANISRAWWKDAIMILLLITLSIYHYLSASLAAIS
ncbi:hypothetical protein SLA2020_432980 [Shorea laevis]